MFMLFSVLNGDFPVQDDPMSKKLINCKFWRKYTNGNIDALSLVYNKMLIVEKYCVYDN